MPKTILNIDIIDTHNTKTIGIVDNSFYSSTQPIINPTFEIYPPGFNKVSLTAINNSVNVFNSNHLKLTCSDDEDNLSTLPDGIWTIKYSINPSLTNYVEKTFIRTDLIECKYDNVFLKLDLEDCDDICNTKKDDYKTLNTIKRYIIGSIAAANTCDFILSNKLYNKANNLIKKLDYNCDCLY